MRLSITTFLNFFVISTNMYAVDYMPERWSDHPEWLWFDDFESSVPLKSNYQDVDTNGFAVSVDDAFQGTHSLRQHYNVGQVNAGWIIKVKDEGYPSHIFVRFYHKFENGFNGFPPKMARVRYRPRSGDWTTVFAVHCWINNYKVAADVYAQNSTAANSEGWLPIAISNFSFENPVNIGRWTCFEVEIQLNTPGQQDGVYRFWADDSLIIERTKVDLRGSENDMINEVMLDCYWNKGSIKEQNRYYDNFVISTKRIGTVVNNSVKNKSFKAKKKLKIDQPLLIINQKQTNRYIEKVDIKGMARKYLLSGELIKNHSAQKK